MEQKSALPEIESSRVMSADVVSEGANDGPEPSDEKQFATPGSIPAKRDSSAHQDPPASHETQPASRAATLPVLKIPLTQDEPSVLWLRRADQIVVAVFLLLGLSLIVYHWVRLSRWGAEPIEIDRLPGRRADYRININQATKYELAELDGIGPTLAERIVQNRDRHGPFSGPDDLMRVTGIGAKTLEKLRSHLTVSEKADAEFPARRTGRQK